MKRTLLLVLTVAFTGTAFAQHVQLKGPNGGPIEDVAGVNLEMIASGRNISFYVFDNTGKPVSSNGITATALVISGSEREILTLSESENALKGEAKKNIAPGSGVRVDLKTAVGKSGHAIFMTGSIHPAR